MLDYRGEIVLQTAAGCDDAAKPWTAAMAHCVVSSLRGNFDWRRVSSPVNPTKSRPCTKDEMAVQKKEYEGRAAAQAQEI